MNCSYGCGNDIRFTLSNGKGCCESHYNKCPAIRAKNSTGLKKAHADGKMLKDAFGPARRWRSLPQHKMQIIKEVFVINSKQSNDYVKRLMIEELDVEYKCNDCGLDEWNDIPITLDLDHMNGNNTDNRIENLQFLCPNCHSQTPTYKGKNMNQGTIKISDDILLVALKECDNIRQALMQVGLTPKGGNYERANRLLYGK